MLNNCEFLDNKQIAFIFGSIFDNYLNNLFDVKFKNE